MWFVLGNPANDGDDDDNDGVAANNVAGPDVAPGFIELVVSVLLPFWPCSSVGKATAIKSKGLGFKSYPGQSFLCPCVGPIPILGLISDGVIGYIKLHSSVRPHSNLESLQIVFMVLGGYSPLLCRQRSIWVWFTD